MRYCAPLTSNRVSVNASTDFPLKCPRLWATSTSPLAADPEGTATVLPSTTGSARTPLKRSPDSACLTSMVLFRRTSKRVPRGRTSAGCGAGAGADAIGCPTGRVLLGGVGRSRRSLRDGNGGGFIAATGKRRCQCGAQNRERGERPPAIGGSNHGGASRAKVPRSDNYRCGTLVVDKVYAGNDETAASVGYFGPGTWLRWPRRSWLPATLWRRCLFVTSSPACATRTLAGVSCWKVRRWPSVCAVWAFIGEPRWLGCCAWERARSSAGFSIGAQFARCGHRHASLAWQSAPDSILAGAVAGNGRGRGAVLAPETISLFARPIKRETLVPSRLGPGAPHLAGFSRDVGSTAVDRSVCRINRESKGTVQWYPHISRKTSQIWRHPAFGEGTSRSI